MKYPLPLTPPVRILSAQALVIALLIVPLLSFNLRVSGYGQTRTASRSQEPQVAITLGTYRQANLVSDQPGVALVEDRLLKNSWGVATNSSSPFWVVNSQTACATLYRGDVSGSPLVPDLLLPSVAIPNVPTLLPAPAQPVAIVANNTNDFVVARPGVQAAPAQFIFATMNGGINAWIPSFGSASDVEKFNSGHNYTGLAI